MILLPKDLSTQILNLTLVLCLGLSFLLTACTTNTSSLSAIADESFQAAASVELGDLNQEKSGEMDSFDIL